MEKMQNQVIIRVHEKVLIPVLLTNAESWTLIKSDEKVCGRIEIGALKSVLELPKTFPSPALLYAMGTTYRGYHRYATGRRSPAVHGCKYKNWVDG